MNKLFQSVILSGGRALHARVKDPKEVTQHTHEEGWHFECAKPGTVELTSMGLRMQLLSCSTQITRIEDVINTTVTFTVAELITSEGAVL